MEKKSRISQKTQRAAKIAIEHPEKPMYHVMREAGFAHNTAIAPKKNLTGTKSWQELMEKYLPDEHLTKKHKEFLDSPREVKIYKRGEVVEEYTETSPQAVKALDMAYKLKNRYSDVHIGQAVFVNLPQEIVKKNAITSRSESDSTGHPQI